MISEIFMKINRTLTELCRLKLRAPVIMPHHVYRMDQIKIPHGTKCNFLTTV